MNVFAAIPKDARPAIRHDYRAFLQARDGVVDLTSRTLSKREAAMGRFLAPGQRDIDRELFKLQYDRFDARRATSPEALLLLALVKVNAAEAWGVNRTFDGALERATRSDDDTEVVLLVEEFYHTKILLSSACLYGIDVATAARPHFGLRAFVSGIATLPAALARPLTLAGEIIGVLTFLNLLAVTREVLKAEPCIRDAIEERLIEILIDEIGHVTFQRLHMGSVGLAQARFLLPVVASGLASSIPEIRALGAMPRSPAAAIASLGPTTLPEAVRHHAFIA